jgi:predicted RNA-binding protein with PUA-like domain
MAGVDPAIHTPRLRLDGRVEPGHDAKAGGRVTLSFHRKRESTNVRPRLRRDNRPPPEPLMSHWLFKSEPSAWSFDQQVAAGEAGTPWNGVRNHQAKLNMMAMKLGETGFFYHSNEGKAVVGIVTVIRNFYPDTSDATGKFGMVDLRAVEALPKPVTLEAIKAEKRLAKMVLVVNSRLSVQPVTAGEWKIIRAMAGL